MSDKSLFAALLRIIGVVLMLLGFQTLFGFLLMLFQLGGSSPFSRLDQSPFMVLVFNAAWMIGLGIYFLRGAPQLVDFAYPVRAARGFPVNAPGTTRDPAARPFDDLHE